MSRDRANLKKLNEAENIQTKTGEAITRIQKNLHETEDVGVKTLEQLRSQDQKLDSVISDVERLDSKQSESQMLQKKFDFWSMNFSTAADKKAAEDIALRQAEERRNLKEVYQNERFDPILRSWRRSGMVSCADTSVTCDDLFDPALQKNIEGSNWAIDYSSANIDAEGWTYSFDFATLNKAGHGEAQPKWNSYVRRRKWKYVDSLSGVKSVFNAVTARLEEQKQHAVTAANNAITATKELKSGYQPRIKGSGSGGATFKATGLSSAGMISHHNLPEDQKLNEESETKLKNIQAKDKEIDAGIDQIGTHVDRILNIAGTMNDEVKSQNAKIQVLDDKMNKATDKQTVINAKLKHSVNR